MGRVIILGAGATAGFAPGTDGICPPTTTQFFECFLKMKEKLPNGLSAEGLSEPPSVEKLEQFLRTYYAISLSDGPKCDVEEILTMIEIGDFSHERRQLIALIAWTLNAILRENCRHHEKLLTGLRPCDTIITFNWDLILDNLVALSSQRHPDYGACESALKIEDGIADGNGIHLPFRPRLLKLHGSFNWMHCSTCKRTYAFMLKGKTGARHYQGEQKPCEYCKQLTEPVMVFPTLYKSYDLPDLHEVWQQARSAVSRATEILVVGYSLPVTDFRAKWLFMEGTAGKARRVRVFDTAVGKELAALKERVKSAFHSSGRAVCYIKGGIAKGADYVSDHCARSSACYSISYK